MVLLLLLLLLLLRVSENGDRSKRRAIYGEGNRLA